MTAIRQSNPENYNSFFFQIKYTWNVFFSIRSWVDFSRDYVSRWQVIKWHIFPAKVKVHWTVVLFCVLLYCHIYLNLDFQKQEDLVFYQFQLVPTGKRGRWNKKETQFRGKRFWNNLVSDRNGFLFCLLQTYVRAYRDFRIIRLVLFRGSLNLALSDHTRVTNKQL